MIKKITLLFAASFTLLFLSALPASAAAVNPYDDICNQPGANNSTVCQDTKLNGQNPLYGPDGILSKVVNILSIMVGLGAVISIIWSGMRFVTSGDNPEEVGKAREYIQYAVIGLVLAALAQALVRLVLYKIGA
ncbi:MAG TPA: pilin [Candidatus Saccharimonadales bacterium]|nr:pilin [Candidatus Saccharimonadales bacterium]